jgi:hypothetical protein
MSRGRKGVFNAEIAKCSLRQEMKGFVGLTDNVWFAFLSQHPGFDEVNFWQPHS